MLIHAATMSFKARLTFIPGQHIVIPSEATNLLFFHTGKKKKGGKNFAALRANVAQTTFNRRQDCLRYRPLLFRRQTVLN